MAAPARSVDSSMLFDDDPIMRLSCVTDDNHEPLLVNQSLLPALTLKPVMKIDQVITGHSETAGKHQPLRVPEDHGKLTGYHHCSSH